MRNRIIMVFRNYVIAPQRGNELLAHGNAMGNMNKLLTPYKGKSFFGNAFALSERINHMVHNTTGRSPGLSADLALSGRLLSDCE